MSTGRYHRQVLLPQVGPSGQERLAAARVLIVGCGALGCASADALARAGVGNLILADRDWVEITNLHRQTLFDETDALDRTPKAVAAAGRLSRVNSSIRVVPLVTDIHAGNIESLLDEHRPQLLIDGTDNVETRYLLNDAAVQRGLSWVYGACVGVEGRVMAVRPGHSACLRCVFPSPPGPGELPTCDTAGVLGPAAAVVGAMQATAALALIIGAAPPPGLLAMDVWSGRFSRIATARREECVCCGQRRFEFLNAVGPGTAVLCGRDSVQIRPGHAASIDLDALAALLQTAGEVQRTTFLLRCRIRDENGVTLTVFPDGRIIVSGTSDPARARTLAARYVGN